MNFIGKFCDIIFGRKRWLSNVFQIIERHSLTIVANTEQGQAIISQFKLDACCRSVKSIPVSRFTPSSKERTYWQSSLMHCSTFEMRQVALIVYAAFSSSEEMVML